MKPTKIVYPSKNGHPRNGGLIIMEFFDADIPVGPSIIKVS